WANLHMAKARPCRQAVEESGSAEHQDQWVAPPTEVADTHVAFYRSPSIFSLQVGTNPYTHIRTWLSIAHHQFSACKSGGVHIRIYGCICPEACFCTCNLLDSAGGSIYVPELCG